MGRARLAFILLTVFVGLFYAGSTSGRELPLAAITCVGGSDSAEGAFELNSDTLDCDRGRFGNRSRFVRTHADISSAFLPAGDRLVWQTDPSSFDSMLVRFRYADGSERLIDVDSQMAVRNWFAGTGFTIPVPETLSSLESVDTVIERPRTLATARDARVLDVPSAEAEHFARSILYALICGLLLVPLVYDLLFFHVLRARFMLWHIAMTTALLLFVLSNSGLIFEIAPSLPLEVRFQMNTTSLAVAVACAVMFALGLLEEDAAPRWLARVVLWLTGLMLCVKILSLFDVEATRMTIHQLFLLSLLPLSLALAAVFGFALANRSRSAVFLAIAFAGMIAAGITRLLASAGAIDPPFATGDVLFGALVVLVITSSAAVGDRFMILRAQRDRARTQALKMGRMAHTDGLTGIANRRAFDQIGVLEEGKALLMADIDRFKSINDGRGHAVGDAVLCNAAGVLRRAFSPMPDAQIFRLGGEEFAVVLQCGDENQLVRFGEHLRRSIEVQAGGEELDLPAITVSVGGALGHGRELQEVFMEADEALFRAKRGGRNRSCFAHQGKA